MFQHRHYVEIAKMVNKAKVKRSPPAFGDYCQEWADMLTGTNPRFDRERFITACYGFPVNGRDKACRIAA